MRKPDKLSLITRNTSEVITKAELKKLLETRKPLRGYIGVEPSGLFHIGWIIWASKLKDLMDAGVEMTFLEATWHAFINDKLGGKLESIHKCASYLEHCLAALGIDVKKLGFVKAEDLVSDSDYWALILRIAKKVTLARVKRAMTIMGRREEEGLADFSKLFYPVMQVADIFYLDLDVCLGGMDQRRAHVLAREVADGLGYKKPVAIHTPLLMGLGGLKRMDVGTLTEADVIEAKMSKSKSETCIFIHDSAAEVRKKILNAFCPPRQVENNPIAEINRRILFSEAGFKLNVERADKHGGPIMLGSFEELAKAYQSGGIHPLDLKNATATALNEKLSPVRKYFAENPEADGLLREIEELTVSR